MQSVDVNVLLYAVNSSSEHHDAASRLLTALVSNPERVAILPMVALGFLRIATDRRILQRPLTSDDALGFLHSVTAYPHVAITQPAPSHINVFEQLFTRHRPVGPDITDVYLAACAIDMGASWLSFDRGFERFIDLDWKLPT
ncbi:MAG: TA system VapC family ribonuclease toxin [Actinomycetes bacterium]